MDEKTLLGLVTAQFDGMNIPYMVTGSIAVSYYGVPRATHDIDVVVMVSLNDENRILEQFQNEFYVSDVVDAIRHRQMFNLIHQQSHLKIDCWVLDEKDQYRTVAFHRRQQITLWGKKLNMISKEDLVIAKLLWQREAQSDRHLEDVRGILRLQAGVLDLSYIDDWCERLSIAKIWSGVKSEVKM